MKIETILVVISIAFIISALFNISLIKVCIKYRKHIEDLKRNNLIEIGRNKFQTYRKPKFQEEFEFKVNGIDAKIFDIKTIHEEFESVFKLLDIYPTFHYEYTILLKDFPTKVKYFYFVKLDFE